MNERVRKTIIFLTLPAAIIWGIMNYPSGDQTQPDAVAQSDVTITDSIVPDSTPPAASRPDRGQINTEAVTAADWGQDPFRCRAYGSSPLASAAPQQQQLSWILKGIIYNSDAPVAYINNRQVRVGDVVNQARVKEITRTSVLLDHNGRQIKLAVNKG